MMSDSEETNRLDSNEDFGFHEDITDTNSNDELSDEERKQKIIDLKTEGNQFFKKEEYEKAINCYLQALEICQNVDDNQTKSILYSNLAAAKDHLKFHEDAIELCNKALELNESYPKALLRRGQLYKKLDKLDESLADFKKYLELCPNDTSVLPTMEEVAKNIEERNEKLKAEMLSKLKDLGNAVLKPFGLSTDNFKMVKNPETGSYTVDFQKNQ